MEISGFNKLTLLDYPGYLAAIIFTQGCNFQCPFCQNSTLIDNKIKGTITEQEVLEYLEKRKNVLDGLCISGGEPLLQRGLESFIRKVKDLGYKVKLDTNGSNPDKLKKLLDNNLLDYVAMDIKNDFNNYDKICGLNKINIDKIKESMKLLVGSKVKYEFRTTLIKEYHNVDSVKEIYKSLDKKASTIYKILRIVMMF